MRTMPAGGIAEYPATNIIRGLSFWKCLTCVNEG